MKFLISSRVARSVVIASAFAGVALAAPVSAANLLANDGFENTGFGGTTSYYNVGQDHAVPADFGFSVPVNSVDIVANGAFGPTLAGGGAYNLDLVGYGSTGAIAQSIHTVAGKTYTVSIAYSSNNGINGPTADVTFNGATIGSVTGTHAWQTFTTTFTGTGTTASFGVNETFGANNGGVFLDNLSVSGAVPEPATWALLIVGFGMVGVAARRRAGALVA